MEYTDPQENCVVTEEYLFSDHKEGGQPSVWLLG